MCPQGFELQTFIKLRVRFKIIENKDFVGYRLQPLYYVITIKKNRHIDKGNPTMIAGIMCHCKETFREEECFFAHRK